MHARAAAAQAAEEQGSKVPVAVLTLRRVWGIRLNRQKELLDMWWNNGTGWGGMGWGGMGAGGWVVMTVVMVAVVALVVAAVVALLRRGRTTAVSDSRVTPAPTAESVLDERFARGEIDAQEYQTRRTALRVTQQR